MSNTQLTSTQTQVLQHAIDHSSGRINWFPDSVKGGARKKVLDALLGRKLIMGDGSDWLVATPGYEALGCARPAVAAMVASPTRKPKRAPNVALESAPTQDRKVIRTRNNSKQAMVIAMLTRSEGATINQICTATDWQAHTVRGTLAGAFKRKLGLTITSTKDTGGKRVYRIIK
jgi:hypothetical protein